MISNFQLGYFAKHTLEATMVRRLPDNIYNRYEKGAWGRPGYPLAKYNMVTRVREGQV